MGNCPKCGDTIEMRQGVLAEGDKRLMCPNCKYEPKEEFYKCVWDAGIQRHVLTGPGIDSKDEHYHFGLRLEVEPIVEDFNFVFDQGRKNALKEVMEFIHPQKAKFGGEWALGFYFGMDLIRKFIRSLLGEKV